MDNMENLLAFARILGDETRQQMMQLLCCHELSVNQVVAELAEKHNKHLTQPTVSHHLAEMRELGIVIMRREGRQSFYELNQERVTYCCGQIMANFAPNIPLSSLEDSQSS